MCIAHGEKRIAGLGYTIGDKESYEHRDCINVKCVDGEYLHVDGNLVVEIKRSAPVEIDL